MIEQGSEAWKQQRLGRVTASRIADVIAKTRTGWGASRANYMAELLVERLTGIPHEGFANGAMLWGTETEPLARSAYAFLTDNEVTLAEFVPHPIIAMSGASPDGYVGDNGLVEIKCATSSTHIDTLLGAPIPDKHIVQMQYQMACCGRAWCDWCSFDPRLPAAMQLHVRRVVRDDKRIAELEKDVTEFLAELDAKLVELSKRYVTREPDAPASRPHRQWDELSPAQQAGIACADLKFRRFLLESDCLRKDTEEDAAIAVRLICGVTSRSDIKIDTVAERYWNDLYSRYQTWLHHPELTVA